MVIHKSDPRWYRCPKWKPIILTDEEIEAAKEGMRIHQEVQRGYRHEQRWKKSKGKETRKEAKEKKTDLKRIC